MGVVHRNLSRAYSYLIGFLGCYEVGIQSFNLRVEAGHLAGGENHLDMTSSCTPNDERMNCLSVLICRYM